MVRLIIEPQFDESVHKHYKNIRENKNILDTPKKIKEETYGNHIYMRILMPSGVEEEIDVYIQLDGKFIYKTTADKYSESERQNIIDAFNELY